MNSSDELRKQAESLHKKKFALPTENLSIEESRALIHEFHIHQIELEMQNAELIRREQELQIANDRFFNLFDLAPVGYLILNEKEIITQSNLAAAILLGVARSTLISIPFTKFLQSEDQDAYFFFLKQLIATKKSQSLDLQVGNKKEKLVWVQLNGDLLSESETIEIRLTLIDISERKLREAEAEKKWSVIVDSIPDYVVQIDRNYRVICINRTQDGFKRKDIIGQDLIAMALESDQASLRKRYDRIFETGVPDNWELQGLTGLGKIGWYQVNASRLVEANGDVSIMIISSDITERKQAELKLQESEFLFRETFEKTAVGMVHASLEGRFLRVNPVLCAMLGYSQEELLALTFHEISYAEDLGEDLSYVRKLLNGEQSQFTMEKRYWRKDRTLIWIQLSATLVRNVSDEPNYFIAVINDITNRKLLEMKLSQSNDYLSLATAAGGIGIWDYNITNDVLTWDDQMFRLYGVSPYHFSGAHEAWKARVHPEDIAGNELEVQMAFRGEKGLDIEFRVIWPDGTIRHIAAKAEVHRDALGQPIKLIGTNYDITERKQAEQRIIESERQYHAMFDVNIHGIVCQDKYGVITEANEAAQRILGLSFEQLTGRSSLDSSWHTIREDRSLFPGEDHPAMVALRTGRSSSAIMGVFVSEINGYRWIDIESIPLFQLNEKEPYMAYTMFKDITAAHNNFDILQNFKDSMDAHSIVAITDTLGVITYVNDTFCQVSKYSREELIGKTHKIVNSGYHPKEFFENLWKTIKNKKVWKGEIRNRAKDGSFYWVNTTIVPFLDKDGEPYQYLAIRVDITARVESQEALAASEALLKQAKEKAESATRAKSEFLAVMSHEIRTPLNGVIGFVDLLFNTELNSLQSNYLGIVSRSANSLLSLLTNILDFSKIEAGKLELTQERCNIVSIAEQAVDSTRFTANEKKIEIFVQLEPNIPPYIIADSVRLRQVLINLLGNAIKFTEAGSVTIRLENLDSDLSGKKVTIRFSVIDTGIGVSIENQQKIFETFTQADASTTRQYGGTGLGLSISNQLLGLMDSYLRLESEVGRGSKFYFQVTFPLPEKGNEKLIEIPGEDPEAKNTSLPKYKNPGNAIKILIVDDDGINLFLAVSILAQMFPNGKLFEAENGYEAIESFRKEQPDIIFMDIQMPKMNGYDATIEIRKLNGGSELPIIALTAGTVMEDINKCILVGMDDYASKPIKKNVFENIFQKYFGYKFETPVSPQIKPLEISMRKPIDMDLLKLRLGMEDEIVRKIIVNAISTFLTSLSELKRYISERAEAKVKTVLHKMNGTALSICCNELARLSKELESISIVDEPTVGELISKIATEVDFLQEFMKFEREN